MLDSETLSIKTLLQYELTSTSFYLIKDGYPRKPDKAELAVQISRNMLREEVPNSLMLFSFDKCLKFTRFTYKLLPKRCRSSSCLRVFLRSPSCSHIPIITSSPVCLRFFYCSNYNVSKVTTNCLKYHLPP